MELLQSKGFIAVIGAITIGVIIRLIYGFLIKPSLKKEGSSSNKQSEHLIKNALSSREDLRILLKFLINQDDSSLKDFYHKIKSFDKKDLSKQETATLEDLLKELKKLSK